MNPIPCQYIWKICFLVTFFLLGLLNFMHLFLPQNMSLRITESMFLAHVTHTWFIIYFISFTLFYVDSGSIYEKCMKRQELREVLGNHGEEAVHADSPVYPGHFSTLTSFQHGWATFLQCSIEVCNLCYLDTDEKKVSRIWKYLAIYSSLHTGLSKSFYFKFLF